MTTFNAGSIEATLDLDRTPFTQGLQVAREQGRSFAREKFVAELGLRGDQQALATLLALQGGLSRLDRTRASAHVEVDGAAAAIAELELLDARLDSLGRSRVTAGVDASGFAGIQSGASGAVGGIQMLIAAGALIGPALIPGLAGAAAAAGGLVSALVGAGGAAAALGAGVIGNIKNVLGAQDALTKGQQAVATAGQQAAASQQAAAAAAHQVDAAEQALSNARRARAQAIASAQDQVKAATEGVTAAQENLNDAIDSARDRLKAYEDQLAGSKLDKRGAELAIREAQERLDRVLADPASSQLERDEAQYALDQALFNLDQVDDRRKELKEQAREDRRDGVRGSEEVKAAQKQLRDAKAALAQAEQALSEARRAGAEQVAAAQYALTQAQEQQQAAAEAAATSTGSLAQAQADQAGALATLATPAAEEFLAAIDGVKEAWQQFLDATEGPSLGLASDFLEMVADVLANPATARLANDAAEAVGGLLDAFSGWMSSPEGQKFRTFLATEGPTMLTLLGNIGGDIAEIIANVAEAFGPFAEDMLAGLDDVLQGWADTAAGFDENPQFPGFLDYVVENGPLFLDVLSDIGGFFIDIGESLAPIGPPVLRALHSVFQAISDMDPTTRAVMIGIAGAIAAITVAPVAGTAIALVGFSAALASIHDDGGPAADILASVTGGLEDVRDVVRDLAENWLDGFKDNWDQLDASLQTLADTLDGDLGPAWDDFYETFGPFLRFMARQSGRQAAETLSLAALALGGLATNLAGVLNIASGTFSGDWKRIWRGFEQTPVGMMLRIPGGFNGMFGALVNVVRQSPLGQWWSKTWERIQTRVDTFRSTMLDSLIRGDESLMSRLKVGFNTALEAIGTVWNNLKRAAGTPVKFVVDYVWNNGLRKVINSIPGVDDMSPIDTSSWPSYATGGYTGAGGKYQPAGVVHAGEYVFSQEATSKAGVGVLDQLHKLLRGYASGGVVFPLPGKNGVPAHYAANYAGHDGVDINWGSGSDDLGMPFVSATGGTVTTTGYNRGYGNAIFVSSPYGELVYGHSIDGSISVAPGDKVTAGQYLAQVGETGNASAPHLHFGYAHGGTYDAAVALLAGAGRPGKTVQANPLAKFAAAIKAGKAFVGALPGQLSKIRGMGPWGDMVAGAALSSSKRGIGWVNDKIPGPGPIPTGVFDQGGWMQPGWALNASTRPEAVLTDPQWHALSTLAAEGGAAMAGGISTADIDRLIEAIMASRSVYAAVSSRDELEDALAAIEAKLRGR